LVKSGVTVHSVTTIKSPIDLDGLSSRTNGRQFLLASDDAQSSDISTALRYIAESVDDSCHYTAETDWNSAGRQPIITGDTGESGKNTTKSGLRSTGRSKRAALGKGLGGRNLLLYRIKDLVVSGYNQQTSSVTLEWTAVGEEAASACEYELRYGLNGTEARKDFVDMSLVTKEMVISGDLENPQPSGAREVLQISLPSGKAYYTFGIVIIDKKLRKSRSEVSNFVSVNFNTHTSTPTATEARTFVQTSPGFLDSTFAIHISIICAVALFMALVAVYIRCRPSRMSKAAEKPSYEENDSADADTKLLSRALAETQRLSHVDQTMV
ncbi:hypothetical protein CAPTEDRAFT_202889, partial [Capitella teleta]